MGWKLLLASVFRAVGLLGALVGAIYLPADLYGIEDALAPWGLAMNWLDREVALAILSGALVLFIIYRDFAPFVSGWIGGRFAPIQLVKEGLSFRGHAIKSADKELLNVYKVCVYLRVFNYHRSGESLKNLQLAIFFMGEKYRCKTIDGEFAVNISHGGIEDFCIGHYYTKVIPTCYETIDADEHIKGVTFNLNNGHQSYKLPADNRGRSGGLSLPNGQGHKWSILAVASADGKKAQSAVIEIENKDGDLNIKTISIRPFN